MERIGDFTYNQRGEVVDWGNPNYDHTIDSAGGGAERVRAWRVWKVIVYTRDFPGPNPYRGDEGWEKALTYYASNWAAINVVNDTFFRTAGLCHRWSYFCERWVYSEAGGWEPEDEL